MPPAGSRIDLSVQREVLRSLDTVLLAVEEALDRRRHSLAEIDRQLRELDPPAQQRLRDRLRGYAPPPPPLFTCSGGGLSLPRPSSGRAPLEPPAESTRTRPLGRRGRAEGTRAEGAAHPLLAHSGGSASSTMTPASAGAPDLTTSASGRSLGVSLADKGPWELPQGPGAGEGAGVSGLLGLAAEAAGWGVAEEPAEVFGAHEVHEVDAAHAEEAHGGPDTRSAGRSPAVSGGTPPGKATAARAASASLAEDAAAAGAQDAPRSAERLQAAAAQAGQEPPDGAAAIRPPGAYGGSQAAESMAGSGRLPERQTPSAFRAVSAASGPQWAEAARGRRQDPTAGTPAGAGHTPAVTPQAAGPMAPLVDRPAAMACSLEPSATGDVAKVLLEPQPTPAGPTTNAPVVRLRALTPPRCRTAVTRLPQRARSASPLAPTLGRELAGATACPLCGAARLLHRQSPPALWVTPVPPLAGPGARGGCGACSAGLPSRHAAPTHAMVPARRAAVSTATRMSVSPRGGPAANTVSARGAPVAAARVGKAASPGAVAPGSAARSPAKPWTKASL
ncbi:unnamed protein product [Prorocentrum cordatum]|uniref:Uncharacterized protein n=1 Tax=Prorocentrum cordatum TaxID=2364126 RepID=A0ABN9PLC3_9DINO|nr:unnamed protein product [Polarella glacialis]